MCHSAPLKQQRVQMKEPIVAHHRVTLHFQDEGVCRRSRENAKILLNSAMDETSTSTSALLAKKALTYRKVLNRVKSVDVTSPDFNASTFFGVDWCKTSNLEAFCSHRQ